ncbi:hypothetical protein QC763_101970 [Podospora pseudopauciseta]|uniref:Beta-glucuronidase C-terminal domain-containing protein n=1 Tax=Podospora pseudopauciseta TaxID=2093780 RepID=A0ABR0HX60_9PEZI|nr:hypothetical protein QC763_101970 [Podospora pseudopauciseta]
MRFSNMKQAVFFSLLTGSLVQGQFPVATSITSANEILNGFVSFSIEFSSFPDFAGNNSHPNTFSDNLLENIRHLTGTKPYIRVGGNTQDYALYNASLPYALNGTFNPKRSLDYPTTIYIGPSYFESYSTWKDVKFSHGFNLGLGANTSEGWQTLLDTVPLACKALSDGKLYLWGYGNEPDLFSTAAQGPIRPPSWNESAYVWQWQNGTRTIHALVRQHCPDLARESEYGYMAPSHGGVGNRLKAHVSWAAGLNSGRNVRLYSTHNYISGATTPGVTLQSTLLNHTVTARSVNAQAAEYYRIVSLDPGAPPPIFGETNSLYNQGRPGLSNTFGAALWVVDFNLYAASKGFKRVHMHQGTNYRYASWQPIETNVTSIGTKPPYYGNIATAAALGRHEKVEVVSIPLTWHREAAYAIYHGGILSRVVVVNMRGYNTTVDGEGLVPLPNPPKRGSVEYSFQLGGLGKRAGVDVGVTVGYRQKVKVQRLRANGSDAVTGISWDGWSYNYELDQGRPARMGNVTTGEEVEVDGMGRVKVGVEDSSAALLVF